MQFTLRAPFYLKMNVLSVVKSTQSGSRRSLIVDIVQAAGDRELELFKK